LGLDNELTTQRNTKTQLIEGIGCRIKTTGMAKQSNFSEKDINEDEESEATYKRKQDHELK